MNRPDLRGLRLHRVHPHPDVHDRAPAAGSRARSSCSSFRNALVSSDGTGRRSVRSCVPRGFELEAEAQLVGGEAAGGQARGQSVDQARQQEGQRLQQFDGIFQFDLVFEPQRIFERQQLAVRFAARQFAQVQPFGPSRSAMPRGGSAASS